jgi:PKD repeat protein
MKKITSAAVILFATACLFSCSKSTPPPLPTAGFNYPRDSKTSPIVSFTNTAQNATTYSWNFGDGYSSTLPSPSHTYASAGTYTVTQTVTNSSGTDVATGTLNIGAASMTISNIEIENIPNSAIYQKRVYIYFTDDAGTPINSTAVYVASTATTYLTLPVSTLPITDFSQPANIYLYQESVIGVENPSSDILIFGASVNFTTDDNTGFQDNGNYSTSLGFTAPSGYYTQIFTVSWQ